MVDDSMGVRGFVNVHDLFRAAASGWMDSSVSEAMSASGSHVHPVPTVGRAKSASRALEVFRSSDAQVVAVVDADGRLVGTILERELLRYLFRGRSS